MVKRNTILLSIVFVGVFLIGYVISNNTHYKSRQFLNNYDYHIDKKLETTTINLQEIQDKSRYGIDLYLKASALINMPLDEYINQDLRAETYRLKEESQWDLFGEIDATILFNSKNEIVGGYLNVIGYLPSLLPLNQRYFLAPEPKLNPEKLNFANIKEITITDERRNEKVLKDNKEIQKFLGIINRSAGKKEDFKTRGIFNIDEYRVWFKYKNGALIDATIYIHEDFNKIRVKNLPERSFEVSRELGEFLDLVFE